MSHPLESLFEHIRNEAEGGKVTPQELRRLHGLLHEETKPVNERFKVGDIVTWKCSQLANCKYPTFGQPCIVTAINPGAIETGCDSSSTFYRQPIDLVIGCLIGDHYAEYHVDSRRFTHFTDPDSN